MTDFPPLTSASSPRCRLALVSSPGGHIYEMYLLKEFWSAHERFWITFQNPDTTDLLADERVYWASPMPRYSGQLWRSIPLYVKALRECFRILKAERPSAVVSTGANIGAPAIHAAKLLGIRTIYIELSGRMKMSLTGKLVYPFADYFLVQWPHLRDEYPRARYEGRAI